MSSPVSIYTPVPIEVVNYDFETSSALPPVGWETGSATPSYDTTTPYEGTQSLVSTVSANFGYVRSITQYPVQQGQVYGISGAAKVVSGTTTVDIQFAYFDANGDYLNGTIVATTSTSWALLTAQSTVPDGAVYAQVYLEVDTSGGVGEFDVIQVTLLSTAVPYYMSLLTSQYQNSPNLKAFLALLLQPFVDTAVCAASMNAAFNLNPANGPTAVGPQLDYLGEILGASRTLPFNPVGVSTHITSAITSTGSQAVPVASTQYMVIGAQVTLTGSDSHTETVTITAINPGVSFSANFTLTHVVSSTVTGAAPSSVLDDSDYRILLQSKVLENQFNGQYMGANGQLWQAWQVLFPGGHIYVTDNQNMTATIFLVGTFSPIQQQMITNGLIVPRAESVEFIYEFPELPVFGFDDLNPTFIAGFDLGHWA